MFRFWILLFAFLFGISTSSVPNLIWQIPESETVTKHRAWPYFYGIEAIGVNDSSGYVAISPSQMHVNSHMTCSFVASNMRNEFLKLNLTTLASTEKNDTIIQFYDEYKCTGEKSYVHMSDDLCRTFDSGAVYFYWRSISIPPLSKAIFTKSKSYQCSSTSVYDEHVWTFENTEHVQKCIERPSLSEYAYHATLVRQEKIVQKRIILSPSSFFDAKLNVSAYVLNSLSPFIKAMQIHEEHGIYVLFHNPLRCFSKSSYLLRIDKDTLDVLNYTTLENSVSNPSTSQATAYHHTPVKLLLYRDFAFVVFYENTFSPVVAYNISSLEYTGKYIYFKEETTISGQTLVSYVSKIHNALMVRHIAWLFSEDELLLVDMEETFMDYRQPNISFTKIIFSEGLIHSLTHDSKKKRVFAMAHSRLFVFDDITADIIPYSSCSRIKEYDSTWGLSGPLVIDSNKGHGYLYPSGSIQQIGLRNLEINNGDGTYFTDEHLRDAMRRGWHIDTMHVNHANVSVIAATDNILIAGVHLCAYDFQPPLLLVYKEPSCARGRAGTNKCNICTPGKFTNDEGQSECRECRPGTIATANESVTCEECPSGKYSISPTSCLECVFGKYSDETGMDQCKECSVDKFHMQIGSKSMNDCIDCPVGKITVGSGQSQCIECPAGRIKGKRVGICEACEKGKYRAVGQPNCQRCPVGKYGTMYGAVSIDECLNCPPGTFGVLPKKNVSDVFTCCEPCPSGKISNQGSVAKTDCYDCMLGKTSVSGDALCTDCKAGKYTKISGSYCEECPSGKINRRNGSLICETCEKDSVPGKDSTSCVCDKTFYGVPSMEGGDGCKMCPTGGHCIQTDTRIQTIVTKEGFWRHADSSEEFFDCKDFYACSSGQWNESCREGHRGPLCNVCDENYAKKDGLCAVCPPEQRGLNIFISLIAPVILIVILVLLIRSANPRDGTVDKFSGVSKIATSYMQVYSLCYQFDVNWPPIVRTLFEASDYINPTISFYSSDCSFQWNFFDRLWFYLLMPPIYVTGVLGTLYGLQRYYKDKTFLKRWVYPSVVVGIFLAYPSVIKMFMRVLSCDKIGEMYYLSTDYSVLCYTPEHNVFYVLSAIALVLYGVGFPLSAFMILYHYKHRLYDSMPRTLHFLFNGYRLYYWEFVILSRKIAIVCMSVFLFKQNSERYQAVAVSWLLQMYMFFHLKFKPFDLQTVYGRMCDRLEWIGLLSTLVTINSGIVFGTSKNDYHLSTFENVLLVVVVIVNIVVFCIFLYYLALTGSKKAVVQFLQLFGSRLSMDAKNRANRFLRKSTQEKKEEGIQEEGKDDMFQVEIELKSMRRRGSSVVTDLERLHSDFETMYAKQRFEWQKYVKMCEDLSQIVDENNSEDVSKIKELFLVEQQKHLKWLQNTLP